MEVRKHFSLIGWAYAVFLILSTAFQFLMAFMLSLVPGFSIGMNGAMLLSQLTMYLFAFPAFHMVMMRIPGWKPEVKGKLSASELLLWMFFCFGITYLGNILGQVLMWAVEGISNQPMESPVEAMVHEMDIPVLFLSTVIVAPVMEELMFRKYLIDRIIPFGQKTVMLISGVSFGLFHGNFYQFFYACGIGMVFAYIYSRTGKIRYSILLHMALNFMGGVVPMLILRQMGDTGLWGVMLLMCQSAFMMASIVSAIVLLFCFVLKQQLYGGWAEVTRQKLVRSVVTAPGVLAVFVITAALFVINFLPSA